MRWPWTKSEPVVRDTDVPLSKLIEDQEHRVSITRGALEQLKAKLAREEVKLAILLGTETE